LDFESSCAWSPPPPPGDDDEDVDVDIAHQVSSVGFIFDPFEDVDSLLHSSIGRAGTGFMGGSRLGWRRKNGSRARMTEPSRSTMTMTTKGSFRGGAGNQFSKRDNLLETGLLSRRSGTTGGWIISARASIHSESGKRRQRNLQQPMPGTYTYLQNTRTSRNRDPMCGAVNPDWRAGQHVEEMAVNGQGSEPSSCLEEEKEAWEAWETKRLLKVRGLEV